MFCEHCGKQLENEREPCSSCGSCGVPVSYSVGKEKPFTRRTYPPQNTADARKPLANETISPVVFLAWGLAILFVVSFLFSLAFRKMCFFEESPGKSIDGREEERGAPTRQEKPQKPTVKAKKEIDLPSIALATKGKVEKELGSGERESSDASGQIRYPWGFVTYEKGFLTGIDYGFKAKPSSVREALEKIGLKRVSRLQRGPLSYYWDSSRGPFICCGHEFDTIVIPFDLSRIYVGIVKGKNRQAPIRTSEPVRTSEPKTGPEERSRIEFAKILQSIYKKEGRRIGVEATGDDFETLTLSSAFIREGTRTLDAAGRETVDCPGCLAIMEKLGFEQVIISGSDFYRVLRLK